MGLVPGRRAQRRRLRRVARGGVTGTEARPAEATRTARRPLGRRRIEADARLASLGLTALAWADVVVLRRWRSTHVACSDCGAGAAGLDGLHRHLAASGHRSLVPDLAFGALLDLLEGHPELVAGRGLVYETDDDVLGVPDWTGLGRSARLEADGIRRQLRLADLVTTTTPVLAARLQAVARGPVRVVRNAVDPAWYEAAPGPGLPGDPRIVYHGVPVRLRDYEVARPAIDGLTARLPGVRRVWLGAAHEPRVVAAVDEARPWTEGVAAFARALVEARPDIGVAPLLDEPYNRAKSELHWVEYALAGAACAVTGFDGPGPYDVVRDGVDGLVARTPGDWTRALATLAESPDLRDRIAAAARERALAEYTVAGRAPEWAAAWAEAASLARRRTAA